MFRLHILILTSLLSFSVNAIHLDIALSNNGGKLKTAFCSDGLACDDLPVLTFLGFDPQTVPIDIETGKNVFITDFNDFEGGPNAVDDPGYISDPGQLPASTLIRYEAVGQLQYWDPSTGDWSNTVPGTTRIELFGGLSEQLITDPQQCGGLPFCFLDLPSSTLFSQSGISGDPTLDIGTTDASGVIHVHLDWFLEDSNDNPGGPAGAYMVEMKITASGLTDSEPFYVMFAKDLTTEQFGAALADRIVAPQTQVPIPAIFILILMVLLPTIALKFIRPNSI